MRAPSALEGMREIGMTIRATFYSMVCVTLLTVTGQASAAPLAPSRTSIVAADAQPMRIDYRPYRHCHGPKRCHGSGSYYKYAPSQSYEPFKYGCRYGCGYNNGWNSPSSRYDYIGRRYGRHRGHRH